MEYTTRCLDTLYASAWEFKMAADDKSILESGVAEEAGMEGYGALADQIRTMKQESDLTSRSGDPYQLMLEDKGLQDEEHAGLTGLLRYGAEKLYSHIFSREDPDNADEQYESAMQSKKSEDQNE